MKAKPSEIKKMAALLESEAEDSEDMARKVWDLVEQLTAERGGYMAVVIHPTIQVSIAIGPYNTVNSLRKDYAKHVSSIDDKSYGIIATVQDPSVVR